MAVWWCCGYVLGKEGWDGLDRGVEGYQAGVSVGHGDVAMAYRLFHFLQVGYSSEPEGGGGKSSRSDWQVATALLAVCQINSP